MDLMLLLQILGSSFTRIARLLERDLDQGALLELWTDAMRRGDATAAAVAYALGARMSPSPERARYLMDAFNWIDAELSSAIEPRGIGDQGRALMARQRYYVLSPKIGGRYLNIMNSAPVDVPQHEDQAAVGFAISVGGRFMEALATISWLYDIAVNDAQEWGWSNARVDDEMAVFDRYAPGLRNAVQLSTGVVFSQGLERMHARIEVIAGGHAHVSVARSELPSWYGVRFRDIQEWKRECYLQLVAFNLEPTIRQLMISRLQTDGWALPHDVESFLGAVGHVGPDVIYYAQANNPRWHIPRWRSWYCAGPRGGRADPSRFRAANYWADIVPEASNQLFLVNVGMARFERSYVAHHAWDEPSESIRIPVTFEQPPVNARGVLMDPGGLSMVAPLVRLAVGTG